ncbi:unnamed protein product [Schistosoma turkestanicum]|nr:unnamed protein product [Schistosoma turkestanicum]
MISELKKTLKQSLSSKSWPSKEDKSRALESVENIRFSSDNRNKFYGDAERGRGILYPSPNIVNWVNITQLAKLNPSTRQISESQLRSQVRYISWKSCGIEKLRRLSRSVQTRRLSVSEQTEVYNERKMCVFNTIK